MPLTAPSLRRLIAASVAAGAIAGSVLFLLQYWTLQPLIVQAERYERAAVVEVVHPLEFEWEPADGIERTAYTAIGTILSGIAFAAILLGTMSLFGSPLDLKRGFLFGAAGFVCFVLAPSIGLAPTPPGVPGAELRAAQLWWCATAVTSAAGLWIIFNRTATLARVGGVMLLLTPYVVGAPLHLTSTIVPTTLVREFAWRSIATRLPFWLLLGSLSGYFMTRHDARGSRLPSRSV